VCGNCRNELVVTIDAPDEAPEAKVNGWLIGVAKAVVEIKNSDAKNDFMLLLPY